MGKLLGSLEKSFYNIRSFLMGSSQEGSSRSEKINDIEQFHPDRLAQRILGMGDVVSFVELK